MKFMNIKLSEIVENIISEFQEDLKKQCLVLMGLPAAGKSTFVNKELGRILPSFNQYKVINSDNQVKSLQYKTALDHYNWLVKNVNKKDDILKFIEKTKYVDNSNKERKVPITFEWWLDNKDKGIKNYFKNFYKTFYATYFDIRDLAKDIDKQLWNTKVVNSGDILIIDTVAAKPNKIIKRLTDSKKELYNNVIIYLEVDPELCIIRDEYRKSTEGRGVGESVIFGYAKQIDSAYEAYKAEGNKKSGVVDRLLKFKWTQDGESPIKGTWTKIEDNKYSLKRRLKHFKRMPKTK